MTLRDDIHSLFFRAQFNGWDADRAADEAMDYLRNAGLDALTNQFEQEPDVLESRDVGSCDWPVQGRFRNATCGRGGSTRINGGIRLCWQHEDALISEAIDRLSENDGHASAMAVDVLTRMSFGSTAPLMKRRMGDVLDSEIAKRIHDLATSQYLDPRIEDALDELINSRIKSQWSDAS